MYSVLWSVPPKATLVTDWTSDTLIEPIDVPVGVKTATDWSLAT